MLARLLFLNRSYWPDAEATGQLLTELCEDLAPDFQVSVIAGQPNHNPDRAAFRRRGIEIRRGVSIHRVWNSRFPKTSFPGRAANLLTYLFFASLAAVRHRAPQVVVVETDPPLLCLLGAILQRCRGARLVVYLQDIYPDLAVALGKLPRGRLTRWLRRVMFAVYRRADRLVVLSRDMRDLLVAEGIDPRRVAVVPNWVDTHAIRPGGRRDAFRDRHRLHERFVVMYSGNIGLCQRLEEVLVAAARLRHRSDIVFVLAGEGASKDRLQRAAAASGLDNVRFLPYQPRHELADSLGAADLHLVPLDPRVADCLMPSKLYGVLAAGRPYLALAPLTCELAELTVRHGVGRVVTPGDPDALAGAVEWAAEHPVDLAAMGRAGRELAVEQYDRHHVTARFRELLGDLVTEGRGRTRGRGDAGTRRSDHPNPTRQCASEGRAEPDAAGHCKPLAASH